MTILSDLVEAQEGKCHYCGCDMITTHRDRHCATVEHLKDKWASHKHVKDESPENLVAACWECNHTRGAIRNKLARKYYQRIINAQKLKMHAASTESAVLFKMFGPVPPEIFEDGALQVPTPVL
jgi:hypothetical protein